MKRVLITGAIVICTFVGYLLLVNSPTLGMTAGDRWLTSVGGFADTQKYLHVVSGATEAYRMVGSILLGGAVFGFFLHAGSLFARLEADR